MSKRLALIQKPILFMRDVVCTDVIAAIITRFGLDSAVAYAGNGCEHGRVIGMTTLIGIIATAKVHINEISVTVTVEICKALCISHQMAAVCLQFILFRVTTLCIHNVKLCRYSFNNSF